MKKLFISIILLFTSNYTYAQDICDAPCFVSIDFPLGGSITATDGMEISFGLDGVFDLGEAGTVNTATQPDTLDYSAGGNLLLAPGESITFGNNGGLYLGEAGNINAINYNIVTTGSIAIISIQSGVTVSGTLEAQSLLIDSHIIDIDDSNLIITENLVTTGIDVSALDVTQVTSFSYFGDGFEWPIDDNTICIVSGNQCITDSGTAYVINENGNIVEITEGSGSIDVWSLLILLLFSLRTSTRK